MEQREGELVYLKLDMDGADGKALSPLSADSAHRKRHVLYAAGRDGGIPLLS